MTTQLAISVRGHIILGKKAPTTEKQPLHPSNGHSIFAIKLVGVNGGSITP